MNDEYTFTNVDIELAFANTRAHDAFKHFRAVEVLARRKADAMENRGVAHLWNSLALQAEREMQRLEDARATRDILVAM